MNSEARFLLIQARTNLLFAPQGHEAEFAFWGQLAMRLRLVEDEHCQTMYTDGEIIGYNPMYVLALNSAQVQWSMVHEVAHCAFGHMWRRSGREMQHWNYATDAVINPIASGVHGLTAPHGVIDEPTCVGKSAEWAYAHLPRRPAQQTIVLSAGSPQNGQSGKQGQGSGQGKQSKQGAKGSKGAHGQGCGCDGVRDAPTHGADGGPGPSEAEWQVAVTQAANAARAAGSLPASLEHLVGKLEAPRVDWRAALRRFVQDFAANDYSWRQPNRKYVASGLYLPTLRSEQMPEIAIAVDTSGSVSDSELAAFFSEIQSIVDEVKPMRTHIIQCDASVKKPHDTFEAGERFLDKPIKVHGRGGTLFQPVLSHIAEQAVEPVCLVWLTDLACFDDPQEPEFETIWVSTGPAGQKGPWGTTIELSDGGVR